MDPVPHHGPLLRGPSVSPSFMNMAVTAPSLTPDPPPAGLVGKLCHCLPAGWQRRARRWHGSALGRRLARGAFWLLAGAGLARGLGLLASMVTARLLGTTQ